MTTFATPGPITATVQLAGARVRVSASDRADTVVQVTPVDPTSRTDVKVAAKTKVAFAGGRLSVKTTASGAKHGSIDIAIDLPSGSGLTVYLANSDVVAVGVLGDCELHTATSRIALDRIGALQANIGAGELAVERVDEEARIDGGKIAVRIGHATGGIECNSAGGGVDIGSAEGPVTVMTGDAPIRLGHFANGKAKLWNAKGDIAIGIAQGATAEVRAESKFGSVTDTAVAAGTDRTGKPDLHLDLRTRHGDIAISPA